MNDDPREASRLRRQLRAFVSQARQNERKLQRFLQQEVAFMAAGGLPALLEELFVHYPQRFQLDTVRLQLADPDHDIRHILGELDLLNVPQLTLFENGLPEQESVELGPIDPGESERLFGSDAAIQSQARLPLQRQSRLLGRLLLGSRQQERFIAGAATDFLERLSSVLAVCIENALNHERLKRLGLVDPLTGLHNRRYFDARLAEEISQARRSGAPLCALYLDIDHFKAINDRYGHAEGDRVLQWIAQALKGQMRRNDVLARLGGEEFGILLADTDPNTAMDIAERIRLAIAHGSAEALPFPITISIGCSTLNAESRVSDATVGARLLEAADQGLYQAKRTGRNRVVFQNS